MKEIPSATSCRMCDYTEPFLDLSAANLKVKITKNKIHYANYISQTLFGTHFSMLKYLPTYQADLSRLYNIDEI